MYKQVFMKSVNVISLLNGQECYGHRREELEKYGVEVYSVMIHEEDVKKAFSIQPFDQYIEPDARFHSLMSMTNVDTVTAARIDKR